ncbi:aldehyde dehydrogenase family protein [Aerococcaceae bacterium WGS1372]
MKQYNLYINGEWTDSQSKEYKDVINPTTEEVLAQIPLGNEADVDKAVQAAKDAFPAWNTLSVEERVHYVQKISEGIRERSEDLTNSIIAELGSARTYTEYTQVIRSAEEIEASIKSLKDIEFTSQIGNALVTKEGVGVVAAITPWNFPLNQIQRKITPALLAGNTVVVKPASDTPITAMILAEIIDEIGFPKGVFNLITGSGSGMGDYLAGHPDVDLISFTGSTEVGRNLYDRAKTSIKKIVLELGGKSALIYLEGGNLEEAIKASVNTIANNSGQTCAALTRLIIPKKELERSKEIIKDYVQSLKVGDPSDLETVIGPLVSASQKETVLEYIQKGKDEGAQVLVGGEEISGTGYFVEPTVFIEVTNDMSIAQEEIFGPVLSVITYEDVDEAIMLANDSTYGLSGAVFGPEEEAVNVARKMRTGNVILNGATVNNSAPFGGYKQSGLGREKGQYGIEDYLEIKAIFR